MVAEWRQETSLDGFGRPSTGGTSVLFRDATDATISLSSTLVERCHETPLRHLPTILDRRM